MIFNAWSYSDKHDLKSQAPNKACTERLVGRAKSCVSAKTLFRFDGWFSHQAANAYRWAVTSYETES